MEARLHNHFKDKTNVNATDCIEFFWYVKVFSQSKWMIVCKVWNGSNPPRICSCPEYMRALISGSSYCNYKCCYFWPPFPYICSCNNHYFFYNFVDMGILLFKQSIKCGLCKYAIAPSICFCLSLWLCLFSFFPRDCGFYTWLYNLLFCIMLFLFLWIVYYL